MDKLKQGLFWTAVTLFLGFVAYKRWDKSDDWIGPTALRLTEFTLKQSASCFEAAAQDYWQIREASQYPQVSRGPYIIGHLVPLASNN
jgi:hypothetical protein